MLHQVLFQSALEEVIKNRNICPMHAVWQFDSTSSQWTKGGALGVTRAHPCVVPVSGTAFVVVGGCKSAQHVEDSMVATAEYLFL